MDQERDTQYLETIAKFYHNIKYQTVKNFTSGGRYVLFIHGVLSGNFVDFWYIMIAFQDYQQ